MNKPLFPESAKILIADDSKSQRNLLSALLDRDDFIVITACNGQEAIELFVKEQPDLVILDVIMPVMDGIAVAKEIRARVTVDSYIPIIFITGSKSHSNLSQCFAAGGDDYIDKPYNAEILLTKINALLRIKSLYQSQLEQKKSLLKYQEIIEQEQLVAATLYENILRKGFVEASILRYSLSPMALFNGDIMMSAKAPENQLHVLLGDFTGHGLSASVGAGPTAEIFYGMVRKGFAATDIVIEINRKLHNLLPTSMFLAASLVTLDSDTNLLQIITCGLPDHYLLNKETNIIRSITSKNLPLGIISSFEPMVQSLKVTANDYLYLFSDGLIESENSQGQQFDAKGVMACLEKRAPSHFDSIMERLQQHTGGLEQKDDVTLVELQCDPGQVQWQKELEVVTQGQKVAMDWKSSMSFSTETLKHLQPVPIMVNFLMEIQGLQRFHDAIFRIVNELFLNALDYGLLAMDPSLKQTYEGLERFSKIKAERLANALQGEIRFVFNHHALANGGRLVIRVKDSGSGFNVNETLGKITDSLHGIGSVQALCADMEYLGCGNQVNAVFEWSF